MGECDGWSWLVTSVSSHVPLADCVGAATPSPYGSFLQSLHAVNKKTYQ